MLRTSFCSARKPHVASSGSGSACTQVEIRPRPPVAARVSAEGLIIGAEAGLPVASGTGVIDHCAMGIDEIGARVAWRLGHVHQGQQVPGYLTVADNHRHAVAKSAVDGDGVSFRIPVLAAVATKTAGRITVATVIRE